ncbi:MAG: sigma-54-dependent Fis family transcriptional regulator [Myxococcota bacterium]
MVNGLDPAGRLPDRLTARELAEQREGFEAVVGPAFAAVEDLQGVVEHSRCALLIANREGVIVHRTGRNREATALGPAIDVGSVWTEDLAGTNGVGITLSEGVPVTVSGTEHLLETLHPFSCTTVPLLDAHQRVFGVVDLTTWSATQPDIPFLADALERLAHDVHFRLFAKAHANAFLVDLSLEPPTELVAPRALVAVKQDGSIAGLSQPAMQLLASIAPEPATTALGSLLRERFGADLTALMASPVQAVNRAMSVFLRMVRAPRQTRRPRQPLSTVPTSTTLEALAGRDPVMQRHVDLIERVRDRNLPLLLLGETGTGKDALAKAIHASGARRDNPFVAVNCASLPESLLDSELFGYAPGTFTGGTKTGKIGKIAAAHRGTLFLDEIGDMPLPLQGRLLRVLAEGEVTPLGTVEPIAVDLQVISATHHDVESLVAQGRFREDLYYRLSGAAFELPALRDRADLPDLVHRILHAEGLGSPAVGIHPAAMACLVAYPWPGNVRQLQQVLRFALACAGDDDINVAHLPERVQSASRPPKRSLDEVRETSERDAVLAALEASAWNVSAAAVRLGVARTTVHRKMRAFGIARPGRSSKP